MKTNGFCQVRAVGNSQINRRENRPDLRPVSPLEQRVSLNFVRYANCWEDADVLCAALNPAPGQRVLSIASAGDNALALAAEGAEVVAVDLSGAQLACLELRCAALRKLDYPQVLAFLGVTPAVDRRATFAALATDLSASARDYWHANPAAIATGIIHAGKLEAYFGLFRRWLLPLIHRRATVEQLFEPKDDAGRDAFWDRWNNRRWRWLFRLFFNRRMMGKLGRDPEFFRYVEGKVSERFLQRARYGLRDLPTHANPFLDYMAHGNFTIALPRYLRPENFARVRQGLERLTICQGPVEQAAHEHADDGFDAFNLSDIFEYLAPSTAAAIYARLIEAARPGARLAYWNTLAVRSRPAELADKVATLDELARELFAQDKAFFYTAFHVDEVRR